MKAYLLIVVISILPKLLVCQELDNTEYHNYAPVFSNDSKQISFYSKIDGNWDIYIIGVDGKNRKRLTTHSGYDGQPSFSPDDQNLIFISDRTGEDEIFRINLKSLEVDQITSNSTVDSNPVFSKDGKSIIHISDINSQSFLFKTNLEDGTSQLLSSIPSEGRFHWSTDRKTLSFVTNYQNSLAICRIDPSGKTISMTFPGVGFIGNPHYSDIQSKFVFDAHQTGSGDSGDGKWELWTIQPDGSELTQLTNNSVDDWGAYWSKERNLITYAGGGLNNTGYEIHLLDLVQNESKQLTFRKN